LTHKVRVSLEAKQDAREYALWMKKERNAASPAKKWLAGLRKRVRELASRARAFDEIPELVPNERSIREFLYHSHRVIFEIDEQTHTVNILRIYHSARQLRTGDLEP